MRLAIAALIAGLLATTTASAYVRTTTSTGAPVAWRDRCAELVLDALENPELDHARLRAVIERAMSNWNLPTRTCTAHALSLAPETRKDLDVGRDGVSAILWRLGGYCEDPAHSKRDVCAAPEAAAVTTVFYVDKPGDPSNGELIEVDIALNGTYFEFSDSGAADRLDLEAVLTHELGHMLGLTHTCYTSSGRPPPYDENGDRAPNCFPSSTLPPAITEATMYNFIGPGETFSRDPLSNEIDGICAIYSDTPGTCSSEPPAGCGCGVGPPHASMLLAFTVALLLIRRRRSSCNRS